MTESPTPETDAEELEAHIGVSTFSNDDVLKAFAFARSLERRLAVATEALAEIREGKGPFNRDHLKHASNTIVSMTETATEALRRIDELKGEK